jgi:hypothetical protein
MMRGSASLAGRPASPSSQRTAATGYFPTANIAVTPDRAAGQRFT